MNTAGLFERKGKTLNTTLPEPDIVRRFKEIGGEFVTFGSDAHLAADLGRGWFDATEIIKASGFKYITYFKNRQPVPVLIT